MKYPVKIEGVDGVLTQLQGENGEIESEASFPPGKPLRIGFELEGKTFEVSAKTRGSRKVDAAFVVRVRFINLRREERDALESLANISLPDATAPKNM